MTEKTARILHGIGGIGADAWNRCANPPSAEYNPFLDHRFLRALEDSGSVSAETGWQPFHIVLSPVGGGVDDAQGVLPMYLKPHSRGEYVFDGGWAEAFYRAGGSYYPKLQVSVPFTPATGRRLLAADGPDAERIERALLDASMQAAGEIEASSVHYTFMPPAQWRRAGEAGCLLRMDTQFHWRNDGYADFDAFLAALSSKKRRNIRRERREALAAGIDVEWITGRIGEDHWDAFYRFYTDTGSRKWGMPYLNRAFFSRIGETMGERILLILCRRAGRHIAGAINFIGGNTLYGRNWGCIEEHRFLHFEACYYQAIDFAIAQGLDRVEAGAQGAHKLARGYLPRPTHSAHWIRHPGLRSAVERYLRAERGAVERDMAYIEERHSPFKMRAESGDPVAASALQTHPALE